MTALVTYPVQVLREHIAGLEAALTQCLAKSGPRPVHKLRTESRRVEALLLLLDRVPGLPGHREEAAHLLRVLARLRRAAGHVRDFDVHRKMFGDLATTPEAEKVPTTPVPKHPRKLNKRAKAAGRLRDRMGRKREKAAKTLRHLLHGSQAKTARAAVALLDALGPSKTLALPARDLLRDAEAILTRDGTLRPEAVQNLKENSLHAVRKAAKAARYVAESLPGDPAVAAAARRFEALQEAGGQWHDALELTRAARRRFGKKHELTAFFRQQLDSKREAYRIALIAQAKTAQPLRLARPRTAAWTATAGATEGNSAAPA